MNRLLAALSATLLSTCVANAMSDREVLEHLSAAHIFGACKEARGSSASERSLCWGEVQMLFMLASAGDGYLGSASRFCPPVSASINQTKKVVLKYIEDRPERLHEPFVFLAVEALRKAWPCS